MEIKFRVFDKLNDRWKYFDLAIEELGHIHHLRGLGGELAHLCQFAGLKDKNGKEVYFGDIIRSFDSNGDPIKHVVLYDTERASFVAQFIPYNELNPNCGIHQSWINEFRKEVIENIYQNPDYNAKL